MVKARVSPGPSSCSRYVDDGRADGVAGGRAGGVADGWADGVAAGRARGGIVVPGGSVGSGAGTGSAGSGGPGHVPRVPGETMCGVTVMISSLR
jgi:hypothetical protein